MNDYTPIIDVTPISHSNGQQAKGASKPHASSQSSSYQQPSWKQSSTHRPTQTGGFNPPFSTTYTYTSTEAAAASKTAGSVIGGIAQIAIGSGLVLIGIPLLVLPGPGLLSIAGGMALAANGTRKLFS